jgi:magnesium chelatase family protein
MLARINTAVCEGLSGCRVEVEVSISNGLPYINIVGLAATTVVESKERIRSAMLNSGFDYPRRRITVNLAPAGVRKNGSHLDLPIALGVLATQLYVNDVKASEFGILGELSLDGSVVGVEGILPMILSLKECGIRRMIVPAANAKEAALSGCEVAGVSSLRECVEIINGLIEWKPEEVFSGAGERNSSWEAYEDFSDISGQENAKRAITIAVAGWHGVMMVGSPGCGKTMLARRIPGIMPEMTMEEKIETTVIYSVSGKVDPAMGVIDSRPFRMPHHSIGTAGLLGGGMYPMPGEITLAHNGVLFLDEISEFGNEQVEGLRIPIEDRYITHFRNGKAYRFPCRFLLVIASNPCRCGYLGDPDHECTCTPAELERHRKKLSGPLMDRIDIHLRMERVEYGHMEGDRRSSTSSAEMRAEIARATAFAESEGRHVPAGMMNDTEIKKACRLGLEEKMFMADVYSSMGLSPRSYMKTLRVARTIADLDGSSRIMKEHLAEALGYRAFHDIYGPGE